MPGLTLGTLATLITQLLGMDGRCCRYFGSRKEAEAKLPFDAGFEAVGLVAAMGDEVKGGSCAVHAHQICEQ